jgi:hypothetical protein
MPAADDALPFRVNEPTGWQFTERLKPKRLFFVFMIVIVIIWLTGLAAFFFLENEKNEKLAEAKITLQKEGEKHTVFKFNITSTHTQQRYPKIGGLGDVDYRNVMYYNVCCRMSDSTFMMCNNDERYYNDVRMTQKITMGCEANGDVYLLIYFDNPLNGNSKCTLSVVQLT